MLPVVVVGSGPTGLLLAGDLAESGVEVTVLERRPAGISSLSRAFGVHVRTLEMLDARGIAAPIVEAGQRVPQLRLFGTVSVDVALGDTRFPYMISTPQYEVEAVLLRRAQKHGVVLRHDAEVVGVAQDADGVDLTVRPTDGGPDGTLRAAWVVGADGVGSGVRRALGVDFPGESVLRSVMLADVRLSEEPDRTVMVRGVPDAFGFLAPLDETWWRVGGWDRGHGDRDDGDPVDLEELRDAVRRSFGTDFGMHDPRWLSRFHSDERQVRSYRVGRVLLAGDAAHTHSPAGGQGMNLGLQDAANLSWKLAAVVRGEAGDALLDTYHAERHPVGRTVMRSSGQNLRMTMARSPWLRAARALLALGIRYVAPLRRALAGEVSGTGTAYARPRGAHRLVGRRAPDADLDGGRLYEALRGGRFVLVAAPDRVPAAPDPRLVLRHRRDGRRTTVLVRPDGYVAWAGEDAGPDEVRAALARWLSAPARA